MSKLKFNYESVNKMRTSHLNTSVETASEACNILVCEEKRVSVGLLFKHFHTTASISAKFGIMVEDHSREDLDNSKPQIFFQFKYPPKFFDSTSHLKKILFPKNYSS
jgi:hypothetical protein